VAAEVIRFSAHAQEGRKLIRYRGVAPGLTGPLSPFGLRRKSNDFRFAPNRRYVESVDVTEAPKRERDKHRLNDCRCVRKTFVPSSLVPIGKLNWWLQMATPRGCAAQDRYAHHYRETKTCAISHY
jgi:hypothetical protein